LPEELKQAGVVPLKAGIGKGLTVTLKELGAAATHWLASV
jgi:hypothetical protein